MRRPILWAALAGLRAVRALLVAAGVAALAAAGAAWPMREHVWGRSLETFAVTLASVSLAAGIGAALLMPDAQAIGASAGRDRQRNPAFQGLVLAALGIAGVLQLPAIAAWFTQDQAFLREVLGPAPDPLGWSMIPAVLLAAPAIAALAVVTFMATSILGFVIPADLRTSALAACLMLQAGLLADGFLLLRETAFQATHVQERLAAAPAAQGTGRFFELLQRHHTAGHALEGRLLWILAGFVVAAIVVWYAAPAPAGDRPAAPVAEHSPPTSTAFTSNTYAVRPRPGLLASALGWRAADYEIRSLPSGARFSFSFTTGILRREPHGPEVLSLRPAERHGLLGRRSHSVADAASGRPFGTLTPSGPDWEVTDPYGTPLVSVLRMRAGTLFASYVARAGERDACRFTWGTQGLTAFSAEMEVEFIPAAEPLLDRALLIALAPLLERQARSAGRRSVS